MVTIDPTGQVIFRVFFPHAARVELVGSFTGWANTPIPLNRRYPGWWTATVAVPAGKHMFAYLVDGGVQVADYAAHGVEQVPSGQWLSRLDMPPMPTQAPGAPPGQVVEAKPSVQPVQGSRRK